MDIWKILGLEPTKDVSAIKRAYAKQTRDCHPEEDPEGFLALREAYQKALDWAEGQTAAMPAQAPPVQRSGEPEEPEPEEPRGWFLSPEADSGPNPFAGCPAIGQFRELYTGKQRKNPRAWMDYFTSAPFLEVYRERQFTALLLETVTQAEEEFPPTKEFLTWLYVAYQFSGQKDTYLDRTEVHFHPQEGARFDGLDSILEIACKGPIPKRPQGNELALLTSFQEYRHLVRLAQLGEWNELAVEEFSRTLDRYVLSYIQDKCDPRKSMDYQRLPAGLRLIAYFLQSTPLPEELYRIAWQKLDLKNAIMGRAKIVYGPLREIILERAPGIEGEAAVSFFKLRQDFTPYAASCYHEGCQNHPEEDKARTDAFFAREDFQKALLNRQFVEQDMLHTWVDEDRCDYFLERVVDFYTQHPAAPYRDKVIQRARQMMDLRCQRRQIEEDKTAPVPEGPLTLSYRPFLRHWLNTGFYLAHSPESGQPLSGYLEKHLPYLPQWSRRFLGLEEEGVGIPTPKVLTYTVAGVPVEVRFHLRYIDYAVQGEDACQPFLEWEELAAVAGSDAFLFLLPAAAAGYPRYEEVKGEILARLTHTAAPEEDREEIAACLAGQVCRLPLREDGSLVPPEEVLPLEWFLEDGARLLGCSWVPEEQTLYFFEQTPGGRKLQRDGVYDGIDTPEGAMELARTLLEDAVSPTGIHLELLVNLPTAVYTEPDFPVICRDKERWGADMPRALLGEAVTREALAELFALFAGGRIRRLELSWPASFPAEEQQPEYESRRSLVFLHEPAGWACLYFDDYSAQSFALVAKWDDYLRVDSSAVTFVPFRQGKLCYYEVHQSFSTIRRHLDTVFHQASSNTISLHAGWIWSYAIAITRGRHKYNLDKLLLGGFPMEWSHNLPTARFYFSAYPNLAVWEDSKGFQNRLEVGDLNREQLQQALAGFMLGGCVKLRLTWGRGNRRRHIVLVQDQGRFLMAWLLDEKQQVQFHVADIPTYLDVEGKKYPKDTFRNRVTPAYLIHNGMQLRCALEQLLACIEEPTRFTGKFAEFASENPVKPRPYPVIRAELVGEE